MVLLKKLAIFPSFFLGNIGHENVFYDILEQEKKNKFKKQQVQKIEKLTFFQRV